MNPGDIYHKTEKGVDEIAHRTYKLPHKLRTMLIMIDGIKPEALLLEHARQLGVVGDFLSELEWGGFITRNPRAEVNAVAAALSRIPVQAQPNQFLQAQQLMHDIVVDKLGSMRGYGVLLKLQRAQDESALRAVLEELQAALTKKYAAHEVQSFLDPVREKLK